MGDARQVSARTLLFNTGWLVGAQVAWGVAMFVRSAVIARHVGAVAYGHWGFALAFTSFFATAADFGLSTLATRDLSRGARPGPYLGTVGAIKVALTAAVFALLVALEPLVNDSAEARALVYILGAQLLVASGTLILQCSFRASGKMALEAAVTSVHAFVSVGVVAALAAGGAAVTEIAAASLAVTVVVFLVCGALALRILRPLAFEFQMELAKALVRETWPLGVAMLTTAVYYYFDRVIMGALGQAEELGWYTAAYAPALWSSGIVSMLRAAFLPAQSRAYASGRQKRALMRLYGSYSLAFGLPVAAGGFVLAEPLLVFVYGAEYAGGTFALRVLSLTAGAMFLSSYFGSHLLVSGRQREYLAGVAIAAVVNVVLNLALIPRFSLDGAAAATLAAETAVFAFMASRTGGMGRQEILMTAARPATAALALVGVLLAVHPAAPLPLTIVLAAAAYAALVWRLGVLKMPGGLTEAEDENVVSRAA